MYDPLEEWFVIFPFVRQHHVSEVLSHFTLDPDVVDARRHRRYKLFEDWQGFECRCLLGFIAETAGGRVNEHMRHMANSPLNNFSNHFLFARLTDELVAIVCRIT